MISYTSKNVNIISFLISILVYFLLVKSNFISLKNDFNLHFISNFFKRSSVVVELNSDSIINDENEDVMNHEVVLNQDVNCNGDVIGASDVCNVWKIIIPKISLEADISEGTSKEIMDRFVGHFEETPTCNGNVGLAAHNRGYAVNYFSQLKFLNKDDEIIYQCGNFKKTYYVVKNIIIKNNDWEYLKADDDISESCDEDVGQMQDLKIETEIRNKLTLITCVENEPEYRRCVQAFEKIE